MNKNYIKKYGLLIFLLMTLPSIHGATSFPMPVKPASQLKMLKSKYTAQSSQGVSFEAQVKEVKNKLLDIQAKLDEAQQQCKQISTYEQAFNEDCHKMEILKQDKDDYLSLLASLHEQQMQIYQQQSQSN